MGIPTPGLGLVEQQMAAKRQNAGIPGIGDKAVSEAAA